MIAALQSELSSTTGSISRGPREQLYIENPILEGDIQYPRGANEVSDPYRASPRLLRHSMTDQTSRFLLTLLARMYCH